MGDEADHHRLNEGLWRVKLTECGKQVIAKLHVDGKLCDDSNGFRAKNFYIFTSSAANIREIINSLRRGSMISAHTADSVHKEVLMLVQIV